MGIKPDFRQKHFIERGLVGETPEEFAAQIKSDQSRFDAAIKVVNLKRE